MTLSLLSAGFAAVVILAALRRAHALIDTTAPPPATLPWFTARALAPEPDSVERAVRNGQLFADAAHDRLRPMLRQVAAVRLRRQGVDLDHDAEEALRLLGPSLHELVRPGRPRPQDAVGRGMAFDELDAHVRRLEKL